MVAQTLNGTVAQTYRKAKPHTFDPDRLLAAVGKARLTLQTPRLNRLDMVRAYVGSNYSGDGSEKRRPLNLLSLYARIVGRSLLAKNPRAMLSVFDKAQKPAVAAMQKWLNKAIVDMDLAVTLQRVVLDALFSVGICKVAITSTADASASGWNVKAGQPGAWRVDLDDWVYDVHARDFTEAGFMGHRYRVQLDVARELNDFSRRRKDLTASNDSLYNTWGDERISGIGRGVLAGHEEWTDMVDLWEIYVPSHKTIYTFQADGDGGDPCLCSDGEPLRAQPWIGPYCGPYHMLGFGIVPGNALPKSPMMDLYDLDEAINMIYRKLIADAHRMKSCLPVRGAATDDAGRLIQANNGEMFRCENADTLKEAIWGGPQPLLQAFGEQLRTIFSWMAGNLDMMGGLSPQSKTATQDKMLSEAASGGVVDFQQTTVGFTSSVLDALGWFHWNHPEQVMDTTADVPGVPDLSVPLKLHPYGAQRMNRMTGNVEPQPLRRQARWEDLDRRVDPYSLTQQTPQMRSQFLDGILTQLQPLMPMLQQQGIMLDAQFYMAKKAEYSDSPDLGQLFTIQAPPEVEGAGGQPEQPGMPANTTRSYERTNRSEVTGPGQSKSTIQALLGQDPGGKGEAA